MTDEAKSRPKTELIEAIERQRKNTACTIGGGMARGPWKQVYVDDMALILDAAESTLPPAPQTQNLHYEIESVRAWLGSWGMANNIPSCNGIRTTHRELEHVCAAAESWLKYDGLLKAFPKADGPAKPKTRMVSVWDVTWVTSQFGVWLAHAKAVPSHADAVDLVNSLPSTAECSRITGPRLQEVPAEEDPRQPAPSEPDGERRVLESPANEPMDHVVVYRDTSTGEVGLFKNSYSELMTASDAAKIAKWRADFPSMRYVAVKVPS